VQNEKRRKGEREKGRKINKENNGEKRMSSIGLISFIGYFSFFGLSRITVLFYFL